jgi:anti-sigma factor RsiW
VSDAAQLVQHSAQPSAYAAWENEARALARATTGELPGAPPLANEPSVSAIRAQNEAPIVHAIATAGSTEPQLAAWFAALPLAV